MAWTQSQEAARQYSLDRKLSLREMEDFPRQALGTRNAE